MRHRVLALALLLGACSRPAPQPAAAPEAPAAKAVVAKTAIGNPEAPIPPQCYTRTEGTANPCWTCHTTRNGHNLKGDWTLQEVYAFSDAGLKNHWTTLFEDPRPELARMGDAETWRYVREDNLTPWLAGAPAGAPRIDFAKGFDAEGFARDGSGWRALRYLPFPGTFWPTNGATDDVYIRLPEAFQRDAEGEPSRAIYRLNLALVEAALSVADTVSDAALARRVEAIDETLFGADLDGDGKLGTATHVAGLPAHYAGAAAPVPLARWSYPAGTEFIHTVRYLDPDARGWLSSRVKEFRYSRKYRDTDAVGRAGAYQEAMEEKLTGRLPWFAEGEHGALRSALGWEYRGWIEDATGALRPQDHEETLACMGCHAGIGITVDSSFALPRKLPGAAGWALPSLDSLKDVPQAGHAEGEVLTYLKRVGGGDEFRANDEMLARWFRRGAVDAQRVRDATLPELLLPSRERALQLNKAYRRLVQGQRYKQGRAPLLAPAKNVFADIQNGDTALRAKGLVYSDGRLWLDWPAEAR